MGVNLGAIWNRWGRVGVAGVLAGALGLGLTGQAFAFQGSMTVPGFAPTPGGGGTFTPSGEAKFFNSVAKTSAIVQAAGRSMTGEVAMTRMATAGRVVAGFCWSNIVACTAAAGVAAWIASDGIYPVNNSEWWRQEVTAGYIYYRKITFGPDNGTECQSSLTKDPVPQCFTEKWCQYNGKTMCRWEKATSQTQLQIWEDPSQGGQFTIKYRNCQTCTELGLTFDFFAREGTVVEPRRMSQIEFSYGFPDRVPLTDEAANDSPTPVPVTAPNLTPFKDRVGAPYQSRPGDPSSWKQDWVSSDDVPGSADPLDTEHDGETTRGDNPETPEDETEMPEEPGTDTPAFDLCEEYPNISACQPLGEAPPDEVPRSTFQVMFQSEPLGLPASCPSDLSVLGHTLSFGPACDIAGWMAPLVTALGAMVAAMIVVAAIRGS